jgi:SRR1
MPHTSRKKKKQHDQQLSRNKRGEVEYADGWTRIARSDKVLTLNTAYQKGNPESTMYPPDDPNYNQDLDEGFTQMTLDFTPGELPDGASLDKALGHYQKCEAEFRQSNTWTQLKKTFDSHILKQEPSITNCICFGLSSPTGLLGPGLDRRNVAMYQLAAFKSVVDILTENQDQCPEAFAQEPRFNNLDAELLSHLGIKVLHHPEGFNLITLTTFAFCPCAEQFVVRGVLFRSPAMYMGSGSLETSLDPETGNIRAPAIGSACLDDEKVDDAIAGDEILREVDGLKELKEDYRKRIQDDYREFRAESKKRAEVDAIKGAGILHHFKKGKESFKLPDFDDHNYALYNIHLFWRSSITIKKD